MVVDGVGVVTGEDEATVVIAVKAEAAVIGKGKAGGKDLVLEKARAGSAEVVDWREAGAAIVVGKSKT